MTSASPGLLLGILKSVVLPDVYTSLIQMILGQENINKKTEVLPKKLPNAKNA